MKEPAGRLGLGGDCDGVNALNRHILDPHGWRRLSKGQLPLRQVETPHVWRARTWRGGRHLGWHRQMLIIEGAAVCRDTNFSRSG